MNNKQSDLVGIGFGPANIALAVQMKAHIDSHPEEYLNVNFLEKQREVCWHSGMLLEDSEVQIHYLKDLISMVDPCNYFSFLNYLKLSGRLMSFINLRTNFPSRIEYNAYIHWVASHFGEWVKYDSKLTGIYPIKKSGQVEQVCLEYIQNGEKRELHTRNVILAAGQEPNIPELFQPFMGDRVIHSSSFRHWMQKMNGEISSKKVVIIGSGQSAAEIFNVLIDKCLSGQVINLMRKFGYAPADDSHFNNEVFNPNFVDYFHALPCEKREQILNTFSQTNYSAVDSNLIEQIYRKIYQLKVCNEENKFYIQPHTKIIGLQIIDEQPLLLLEEIFTGVHSQISCDYIILATGYASKPIFEKLMISMNDYLLRDDRNQIQFDRNYRVMTTPDLKANIYAMGYAERSHGLTDTLLSILPVRANHLLKSLLEGMKKQEETFV